MRQVLFVHGGDTFNTYEEYLEELKTFTVDLSQDRKKWRMSLKDELGPEYEVFVPQMPNKLNAQYAEWKIWMDKYIPHLRNGVVLLGHSLGGVFLAKYLSEERISLSVRALYLISAPFFTTDSVEGGSFRLDLQKIQGLPHKVSEIVIFHAKDDLVVPFSHSEAYALALPGARIRSFEEGGHFIQESFPELVEDIKGLG